MSHDLILYYIKVQGHHGGHCPRFFLKCGKFDEMSRTKFSKISYKFHKNLDFFLRKVLFFGIGFLLNVWAFIDNWAFIDKR